MFCANCGKKLEDGASFCAQCGSAIWQSESVSSQPNIGMKKSLGKLPVIIGICAAAVIVTIFSVVLVAKIGFGGKDADAISDEVEKEPDDVKVTKKLENQYLERIEAYKSYYEQERKEQELGVWVRVTMDQDGLPLLWLAYAKSERPDDVVRTQVLKLEKGKVTVLAEAKDVCLGLLIGDGTGGLSWDGTTAYIYDAEKKLFQVVALPEDGGREAMQDVLAANGIGTYYYYFVKDGSEHTIAYVGKKAGMSQSSNAAGKFYYADGQETSWGEASAKIDAWNQSNRTMNDNYEEVADRWIDSGAGAVEWLAGLDVDTLFRVLLENPVYSSEDLVMLMIANDLYFERSNGLVYSIVDDFDLKAYEAPANDALADWKQLYLAGLDDGRIESGEEVRYSLIDVFADGIPELCVMNGGSRSLVYAVENNELKVMLELEYDAEKDSYYYNGNAYSLEAFTAQMEKDLGVSADALYVSEDYDLAGIKAELVKSDTAVAETGRMAAGLEWKEVYLSALDDGTIISDEYGHYGLIDIHNDGIPELFMDEGVNTAIYTISNGELKCIVYAGGTPCIYNDLALFDGKYNMTVFKIGTDKAEQLFYAEYDREQDAYDFDGRTLSRQECSDEAGKILGTDPYSLSPVNLDYSADTISDAILNY